MATVDAPATAKIKAEQLQGLSDEELRALIEQAGALLEQRKEQRRAKAIEDAKAKLAAVGLTFSDLAGSQGRRKRSRNGPALRRGDRYVNPADPGQVWTVGRGRRPKWLSDLDAAGNMPAPQREEPKRK